MKKSGNMKGSPIGLVGAARILPANTDGEDAALAFYSQLIPRLLSAVDRGNGLSRMLGFRAVLNPGQYWQFLGIETSLPERVPEEMMGLLLGDDFGEFIPPSGTRERFPLTWTWREAADSFAVGEFDAELPLEPSARRSVSMTANAYLAPAGLPAHEDAIEIVDYDAAWPERFEEMAHWLRGILSPDAGRIVHYGSTSVPGLCAKPIIDILVEVPSFETARRCLIPALNHASWEFWWYTDHMIFIRRDRVMGTRTHHVHIAPPEHRLWEGLAFRDYLLAHPETAREYAALKHDLAARFRTDREKYTDAKTAFIRAVTDNALAETAPETLELVEPTVSLEQEFRAMLKEWGESGPEHFGETDYFPAYVERLHRYKAGLNLPRRWVPTSTFWLVADGRRIVGTSRFRHHLVPCLEIEGGHIGYDVRPSERGKGYGTAILRLTLDKAREAGISEALVTCDDDNTASLKIIEKNGGCFIDFTTSEHTGKTVRRYRIML